MPDEAARSRKVFTPWRQAALFEQIARSGRVLSAGGVQDLIRTGLAKHGARWTCLAAGGFSE